MCNPNCSGCGSCGSGVGGVGCSSAYFGKCGHSLLRVLLGLLVVATIFCMGFRLGMIVGMINGGYSHQARYVMHSDNDMMSQTTTAKVPVKAEVKK